MENKILEFIKDKSELTIQEIADVLNIPKYYVNNVHKKYKFPVKRADRKIFTKEEIEYVIKCKNDGKSIGGIAIDLKRSKASIIQMCERENIGLDFAKEYSTPWTNDELCELKEYLIKGIRYREIAKKMRRGTNTISHKARELGFASQTSMKIAYSKELRDKGFSKCGTCEKIKALTEFYENKKNICKECMKHASSNKRSKMSVNTSLSTILSNRYSGAKTRAIRYNMEFDLTVDTLKEIYEKQNGVCFYTKEKLEFCSHNKNTLSIDRINSDKGYTLDNIVLCGALVNNMKNSLSINEFKQIIMTLYQNFVN